MRTITALLALAILAIASQTAAAAKRPVPLPPSPPEAVYAQATNPDPFNTKRDQVPQAPQLPQTTPAPTQAVPTQPPVVVNMPSAPMPEKNGLIDWIHTALLGLLTAIGGKLAFKLPEMSGAAKLDHSQVHDIIAAALNPEKIGSIIKDPDLKSSIELGLVKAIQTGVPGELLQTGLGFVPTVGPVLARLEPGVRKIVLDILQERSGATIDPNAVHAETDNRLSSIEGLLKGLKNTLAEKHA